MVRPAGSDSLDTGLLVLQALASEPRAVVYDLAGLDVSDPSLPDTFDIIDGYLSRWQGTPLLICPSSPEVRRALHSHPLGSRVTSWPTLQAARAAARRRPLPDRATLDLDPVETAPRQVRTFVHSTLNRWQAPHLLDAAALIASELVTNVALHAFTPMTVGISRPHSPAAVTRAPVKLAVRDAGSALPVLRPQTPLMRAGRGLQLVDSVARSWGTITLASGKIVWAVLDSRAESAIRP